MTSELPNVPGLNRDLNPWRGYLLMLARTQCAAREASDVVQDVLVDAVRQGTRFRGTTDAEYAAWLRRILAGKIADAARAKHRGKRDVRKERALEASSARLEAALIAQHSSPSEKAVRAEDLFRLADALNSLPDTQRQAVLLRHAHGWSLEKIAAELNRTPAATAGLLKRGLKHLRSVLDPTETES